MTDARIAALERLLVSRPDDARLRVAERRFGAASFACIHERRMVAQILPRWNPLTSWMRQIEDFQRAA